jgi:ATP-dependent Lon protease
VDKFISKCYTEGFNINKYGLLGDDSGKTGIVGEKQVEIEVIREIRVEVPVEVIKEVEVIREVIKEVPVETIKEVEVIKYVDREVIVEVPVPIIDKIGDETQVNELLLKIQQLENRPPEIVETIKEVQVIKEVSVEKVVEVEKSNDKMTMLQETLQTLRKELNSKTDEIKQLKEINKQLESIKLSQGAVYMKGSNLNENL